MTIKTETVVVTAIFLAMKIRTTAKYTVKYFSLLFYLRLSPGSIILFRIRLQHKISFRNAKFSLPKNQSSLSTSLSGIQANFMRTKLLSRVSCLPLSLSLKRYDQCLLSQIFARMFETLVAARMAGVGALRQ